MLRKNVESNSTASIVCSPFSWTLRDLILYFWLQRWISPQEPVSEKPVPLLFSSLWAAAEGVYTDSMTEINTLSHAELSYQSHPCGVLVDMDTVNIAGSTWLTVLKVQLCVISPVAADNVWILHFKHLADTKGSHTQQSFTFSVTSGRLVTESEVRPPPDTDFTAVLEVNEIDLVIYALRAKLANRLM